MKKLVILNPVIKSLLTEKDFSVLIKKIKTEFRADYIKDPLPGIKEVKKLYKELIQGRGRFKSFKIKPIIDSRCPRISSLIRSEFPQLQSHLAPINPILITGAEIRKREIKRKINRTPVMVIIAPCKEFKIYGSRLFQREIITWREMKNILNFYPPQKLLEKSPVPLGFFKDLGVKTFSASGNISTANSSQIFLKTKTFNYWNSFGVKEAVTEDLTYNSQIFVKA